MAIIYVNDDGSNTSPYDTWAKAATSIETVDSVAAAGDDIYIGHDHAEGASANIILDFSAGTSANPIRIYSANTSTSAYQAGALINTSSGRIACSGNIRVFGVTFQAQAGDDNGIGTASEFQQYEDCTFKQRQLDINVDGLVELRNCTITWTHASGYVLLAEAANLRLFGCTMTEDTASTMGYIFSISNRGCRVLVEDSDLSASDGDIFYYSPTIDRIMHGEIRRCEINASSSLVNTAADVPHKSALMDSCTSGTISTPFARISATDTYWGAMDTDTARYRTGGASDGETTYSWEMTSNSNALEGFGAMPSVPIVRWVDAGFQTIRIYVASSVTLNDDDFWVEVSSPSELATATTQGKFRTTRMAVQGTPAALLTDSNSTWNGTGVGTKQQIDIPISPTVAGPVTVRCFLAKPSTTVYVDPKIELF